MRWKLESHCRSETSINSYLRRKVLDWMTSTGFEWELCLPDMSARESTFALHKCKESKTEGVRDAKIGEEFSLSDKFIGIYKVSWIYFWSLGWNKRKYKSVQHLIDSLTIEVGIVIQFGSKKQLRIMYNIVSNWKVSTRSDRRTSRIC